MLRIPTHRAVPGMVLALPVLHPERPDHVLLKPGANLDGPALEALLEKQILHLWIRYPQTEFLMRYADPAIIHAQGKIASELATCFDIVAADMHADFEFSVYLSAVKTLVERILENHDAAVFLGDLIDAPSPLLSQSTTVCYLSLLMGLKLDAYLVTERARVDPRRAQNVENLGIGALFHDIGMLRLSNEVRTRWLKHQDESDPEYQRHVTLGFDTVRGKIPATASAAVLHHHQRLDGSGFPRRPRLQGPARPLADGEIHIFARIVGMAELFERFRKPPREMLGQESSRQPVPTVRALRRVLEMVRARKLDAIVYKSLLACVPAYAPGSFITLSDNRSCVVTAFDPRQPCRPTVAPVLGFDVDAGDLELADPIDLRDHLSLSIARCDGQDVAADNFSPNYPGEFDLRMQFVPAAPAKGRSTGPVSTGTPTSTTATGTAGSVNPLPNTPTTANRLAG